MAPPNSVKILELCQVAPACSSTNPSNTEFTLPLTFIDIIWLKFPPAESIFFYELTESSPTVFKSIILPKLKKSLSHALVNFLPLAGNLIWPQDSPKPIILCTPNDAVSLTIAESSSAEFGRLSSNEIREAIESRPYIPELCISDTKAPVLALQITLFPNKGFSISFVTHHAVLDGKTTAMFIKAWVYICKHQELEKNDQPPLLPDELIPSFDRSVIKDVAGIETAHLNFWSVMNELVLKSDRRSLKVLPNMGESGPSDLVRATFGLSREDIKFLRKKVQSQFDSILKEEQNHSKQMHLSTFVLTCAYTLASMMKAIRDGSKKVYFLFTVDLRSRSLDPPIPNNYFGNCIAGQHVAAEARIFMEENGVAMIAERFSEIIKGMEIRGFFEGAKERLVDLASLEPGTHCLGVAGSTRFDFYRSDFGWGEPKKVEIASIDRTSSISLLESRDGIAGGVEIGLVLKRHEMETFASLFVNGLKDY